MPCDAVAVMNAQLTVNEVREILGSRASVDVLAKLLEGALPGVEIRVQGYNEERNVAQLFVGNMSVVLRGDNISVTDRGYYADQREVDRIASVVREQATALGKRLVTNKAESALRKIGTVTSVQQVGSIRMIKLTV